MGLSLIASQESPNRARLSAWSDNDKLTTRTRTVYNWLPIFEETEQQALEWHWQTGRPCIRFMFRSFIATAQPEVSAALFVLEMWPRWRNTTRKHSSGVEPGGDDRLHHEIGKEPDVDTADRTGEHGDRSGDACRS
jgi:hypothetical protein